eukprot:1381117-Amphidinium_carterae.1
MGSELDVGGQPPTSIEEREMCEVLGPTPGCPACALKGSWRVGIRHNVEGRTITVLIHIASFYCF